MVQSVDRAIAILELLASSSTELGVTELGRHLSVHKSTAARLIDTLVDHGLVEQNPATGKYLLSFGVVRLAGAVAASQDLVGQSRPLLQELAAQTLETVNLSILEGDQVMSIQQITAPHLVVNVDWVGKRTPLHCSSSGKVFLSHLPPERLEEILSRPLERRTPRTIVDPVQLRRQLARIKEQGFAHTRQELELGLSGVAAPVRDASGQVVAAVSAAGPSFRMPKERVPTLAAQVTETAAGMSRRLGHIGGEVHGT
ncbi:MAG: IclR family transcriptional regulator [Gemmatimonadales bacterium]